MIGPINYLLIILWSSVMAVAYLNSGLLTGIWLVFIFSLIWTLTILFYRHLTDTLILVGVFIIATHCLLNQANSSLVILSTGLGVFAWGFARLRKDLLLVEKTQNRAVMIKHYAVASSIVLGVGSALAAVSTYIDLKLPIYFVIGLVLLFLIAQKRK